MSQQFEVTNTQIGKTLAGLNLIVANPEKYGIPGLISLKFARIYEGCEAEQKRISKARQAELDRFTVWDIEQGELSLEDWQDKRKAVPVTEDGKIIDAVQLTNPKAYQRALETLMDGKVTLNVPSVTEDELKDLKLPVGTTKALLPFIK